MVGHVRCSLTSYPVDPSYRMRDGDATFVPVGADLYAVRGVPQAIAARVHGRLRLYRVRQAG